jgi:Methyltransferase domain
MLAAGATVDDFIQWNSWWTQRYRERIEPGNRFSTTKTALNLLLQRGGTAIVETGTARLRGDYAGSGMATITFGAFCMRYGKHLWTVDILPDAIALSKKMTIKFQNAITYVTGDSVEFLLDFPGKIDLLYLDSMDCPDDDSEPERLRQAQEHQLRELKAAWDKLHERSIILLDDNDFANGGKTRLTNQFLDEQGWTCLMADKQVIWIWDSEARLETLCPA